MRPLLQHASRLPRVNAATIPHLIRPFARIVAASPPTCVTCQFRPASTATRRTEGSNGSGNWLQRQFSTSSRWLEGKSPPASPGPIAMPPPAAEQTLKPTSSADRTPEELIARQERLRREWEEQQRKREEEALRKKQLEEEARRRREEEEALRKRREAEAEAMQRKQEEVAARKRHEEEEALKKTRQSVQPQMIPTQPKAPTREPVSEQPPPIETQKPVVGPAVSQDKQDVVDNVRRVPDEQLPSHQDRQRSNFEKRFTVLMDELLPKIAVVTQKVNTYTGTDYSGIEALRREIQDQEKLVKARRLAIDSTRVALDAALEQQAASQREVVALLERKHSWSSSDLERYMSLIRSEHINDKAVREAKEAVEAAENALEEARSYLEKRERAQYHEEQIWSDTIRRNSTWVTFVLMGVNIFLLLLSLLVLEPWRRRRMVREIKGALEAQQATTEAAVAATATSPYAMADSVTQPSTITPATPATPSQSPANLDVAAENIAPVAALMPRTHAVEPSIDESPTAESVDPVRITEKHSTEIGNAVDEVVAPTIDPTILDAEPLVSEHAEIIQQETVSIQEEAWDSMSTSEKIWAKLGVWQSKAAVVAEDIVSDRPISMRRVDFTTAILQGAAAGAVIAAASIALLLRPN